MSFNGVWSGKVRSETGSVIRLPDSKNFGAPFMKLPYAANGYHVTEANPFGVDPRILDKNISFKQDFIRELESFGLNHLAVKWLIFIFKKGFDSKILSSINYYELLSKYLEYCPDLAVPDLKSAIDYFVLVGLVKESKYDEALMLEPSSAMNNLLELEA